jgi:peroxiredoxin Q/BCP
MLIEGDPAPDFTLTTGSGEAVTLSSLRGGPVVLYFYPKDDTQSSSCSNSDKFDSRNRDDRLPWRC